MNIAVIGGGASGMVAAIVALRNGAKVWIFEKNQKLGRKILATGNGRCNISNANLDISRFHSENLEFLNFCLRNFKLKDLQDFFASLGIKTREKNNKIFPLSMQASSINLALTDELTNLKANILLNTFVKNIRIEKNKFIIQEAKNIKFDKVLVSTGSIAMSKLGSSGSGYDLAKSFHHNITNLRPSLVQLKTKEKPLLCAGVKIQAKVCLRIQNKIEKEVFGDVLFTDYGLSGLSILELSRKASWALSKNKKVEICIDCLSDFSEEEILQEIDFYQKQLKNKKLNLCLNGLINLKLANFLLKKAGIFEQYPKLTKTQAINLAKIIKNLSFNVIDTNGFENAEVVAGGINTKEINPISFESYKQKGLYFSGEVLDIDGDCGGFNLHFAFASGFLAAKAMSKNQSIFS